MQTRKTLDLQNFPPHNKTKSGFDSWCRVCRATYRNGINRGKFRNVISDEALLALKKEITQCVICGNNEKLVVDHDHKTGKVRGILCNNCNTGLGMLQDNPKLLLRAISYLK